MFNLLPLPVPKAPEDLHPELPSTDVLSKLEDQQAAKVLPRLKHNANMELMHHLCTLLTLLICRRRPKLCTSGWAARLCSAPSRSRPPAARRHQVQAPNCNWMHASVGCFCLVSMPEPLSWGACAEEELSDSEEQSSSAAGDSEGSDPDGSY
jgi:hypothetical protein